MTRRSRIILHGKQGANQEVRDAVDAVRADGHHVEVRVTWEAGDSALFAAEAAKEGIDTVIAGGGDGTVNEVLNGLVQVEGHSSALGVIPLGTANDFARSAGIPLQLEEALRVAVETEPVAVDVGRSGDRAFMNVATGGFGTEVTVNTNPKLKRLLGGAAYFITGLGRFSELEPVQVRLRGPDLDWEGRLLVLAVGNARQAGGGHVLCPEAVLDDQASTSARCRTTTARRSLRLRWHRAPRSTRSRSRIARSRPTSATSHAPRPEARCATSGRWRCRRHDGFQRRHDAGRVGASEYFSLLLRGAKNVRTKRSSLTKQALRHGRILGT
jgi:lipid kinase YegS